MARKTKFAVQSLLIVVFATGCASARMSDHVSDGLFRRGMYDQAAERLTRGLKEQGEHGRDVLLFLLDIGLSLHSAGRYEESNRAFLKADQVAEIKDYTSISQETATFLVSDNVKDYKGEDFENVLITTYLAMNYALMGDYENALVEARRVNTKLYRMITEGKRKYKQNAFARYLSAVLYEAEGNYNDAYVDYKNTQKLIPDTPQLGLDLWRCAWILGMQDQMERWDQLYHLRSEDHLRAKALSSKAGKSEIVVLYENGISPRKQPNPDFVELPKFYPRLNPVREGEVLINGEVKGRTFLLENIEQTAIANLDEKYGAMVAKKIANVVAREAISYGVAKSTDNPWLGLLTHVALTASNEADVRSWSLLPRDLQILRVSVEPGTYHVKLTPVGFGPLPERVIQVGKGKKVFVNFRYMP